eukprot:CAMPEP_0181464702 /NCGR_PEP_ID=MMETSP1110-20121109/35570_1 /TAXON_ID=174948 /ORGANISM="Symbiodinium sp., Strain CCMP421" /LENGTH=130 /DNA_ID=CAMNT_0023589447 /DNA_START=40 /DNA_END=429 /DNA_ORIENTATION=+
MALEARLRRPAALLVLLAAPAFVGNFWRSRPLVGGLAAKGPNSGSDEQAMILDEEFLRGETLEHEFQRVLEARAKGVDIKRDPGAAVKNDVEVALRRAWYSVSQTFAGVDFGNGVTWFWLLIISLIVVAW